LVELLESYLINVLDSKERKEISILIKIQRQVNNFVEFVFGRDSQRMYRDHDSTVYKRRRRTGAKRSSEENQTTFTVAFGSSAFTSVSAQLNNRIFSIAEQKHSSNLLNIV
jgi:hypothetical protein